MNGAELNNSGVIDPSCGGIRYYSTIEQKKKKAVIEKKQI